MGKNVFRFHRAARFIVFMKVDSSFQGRLENPGVIAGMHEHQCRLGLFMRWNISGVH